MDLTEAIKILDCITLDWKYGLPTRYEAYQTLKTAALAQLSHNSERQEILLCAAHAPCEYQDDIKCTNVYSCPEQRKTSAVS